jgi:hypothetical protein
MKPDTPILMITLHIPVLPDTNAEQVLEAIGQQVSEALETIRREQALEDTEFEPETDEVENVSQETLEPYSDDTRKDLLAAMGYKSKR